MGSGSQTFQVGRFDRVHLPPSLSAAGSISAGKWGSSPPPQAAQSSAQGSCSEFILGWGPGAGSRRGEDAQQSHQSMNLEHLHHHKVHKQDSTDPDRPCSQPHLLHLGAISKGCLGAGGCSLGPHHHSFDSLGASGSTNIVQGSKVDRAGEQAASSSSGTGSWGQGGGSRSYGKSRTDPGHLTPFPSNTARLPLPWLPSFGTCK